MLPVERPPRRYALIHGAAGWHRRQIVTENQAPGFWFSATTHCPECSGGCDPLGKGCRACGFTQRRRWRLFVRLAEVSEWQWCGRAG